MADNIDKYTAINSEDGNHPIKGLNCGHCPDQCEAIEYKYRATVADFHDGGDYFYRALLRKGNVTHPPLNKYLIKEYEQYVLELFGSQVSVLGPPLSLKDPRPHMKSCLEKTIRKKISKMTWMHIYFSVSINEKKRIISLISSLLGERCGEVRQDSHLRLAGSDWLLRRNCWTLCWVQSPQRG